MTRHFHSYYYILLLTMCSFRKICVRHSQCDLLLLQLLPCTTSRCTRLQLQQQHQKQRPKKREPSITSSSSATRKAKSLVFVTVSRKPTRFRVREELGGNLLAHLLPWPISQCWPYAGWSANYQQLLQQQQQPQTTLIMRKKVKTWKGQRKHCGGWSSGPTCTLLATLTCLLYNRIPSIENLDSLGWRETCFYLFCYSQPDCTYLLRISVK